MPAWTQTERVTELMAFRAQNNNTTIEEETAKLTAEIPLGRIGQPQEFANAAVFWFLRRLFYPWCHVGRRRRIIIKATAEKSFSYSNL